MRKKARLRAWFCFRNAMRRHFVEPTNASSPTKDDVRKHLFNTPTRRQYKQSPWHRIRNRGHYSLSEAGPGLRIIQALAFISLCILMKICVHLYRSTLQSNDVDYRSSSSNFPIVKTRPISTDAINALRGNTLVDLKEKTPKVSQHRRLKPVVLPIDRERYTIRINTWKRQEQLLLSVEHHSSCPGVAEIQVIWCDKEEEPPAGLFNFSKVVVERHDVNSLNERFNILSSTPTLGILSIDDDVLRPCEAIDSGFFKWTQNPDRMVGFDGRVHVESEDGTWAYGYMSTMEKANLYSMSLPRYCFLHRDYLDWYMTDLPRLIFDTVAKEFNCEDIAMSFMISSMTEGRPSLLADFWAVKSMIKMESGPTISGSKGHKQKRDECVNSFAGLLGLKGNGGTLRLQKAKYRHNNSMIECGMEPDVDDGHAKNERQITLEAMVQRWRAEGRDVLVHELRQMMGRAGSKAYQHGLIGKPKKT